VKDSDYDTSTKMNPPLRSEVDRLALIDGLRDGTIDNVATDHAPHTIDDKRVEYDHAAFGIVGLETAVALMLDRLVRPGIIDLPRLVALLSTNPARLFGLPGGTLAPGAPADVTVLDLDANTKVDPARFASKGRSTPFVGWSLRGAAAMTIVGGTVVWRTLAENSQRDGPRAPQPASCPRQAQPATVFATQARVPAASGWRPRNGISFQTRRAQRGARGGAGCAGLAP